MAQAFAAAVLGAALLAAAYAAEVPSPSSPAGPYAAWASGPSSDPDYFPIGVWLQDPANATRYKEAGINLFVGLWRGPTDKQLAELNAAGMRVICELNDVGMKHLDDKTIAAWMHNDEPDNCQGLRTYWRGDYEAMKKAWPDFPNLTPEQYAGSYGSYGAPVPPARIERDYNEIRGKDPSRPVYLNLGVGVAFDRLPGRGIRSQHPEDYYQYTRGCDVVSYDVYPEGTDGADLGKLWLVARGVKRLYKYSDNKKIVWNIIEGARSEATRNRPTPQSLRTEAWMSIIHGSRGIIYFVHLFRPSFVEAGVLQDPELLAGMTALNKEIRDLARVLNSPTVEGRVSVASSAPASQEMAADGLEPIAAMTKEQGGALYVFAVRMEDTPARGAFQVAGLPASAQAEVLGEGRTVDVTGGAFSDDFQGYTVHLYKITSR